MRLRLCAQPMRCLCESKLCRGFIGGTGESTAVENGDLEDPADASNDPEPIMLEVARLFRLLTFAPPRCNAP